MLNQTPYLSFPIYTIGLTPLPSIREPSDTYWNLEAFRIEPSGFL